MSQIIKTPLVTEKNTIHNAAGIYVFEVDLGANKDQIKKEIEKYFKVKVSSVRTSICRGRAKNSRFGAGAVPRWKKALVKLAAGEKIALFEGA